MSEERIDGREPLSIITKSLINVSGFGRASSVRNSFPDDHLHLCTFFGTQLHLTRPRVMAKPSARGGVSSHGTDEMMGR
jgi:hypothetical protein